MPTPTPFAHPLELSASAAGSFDLSQLAVFAYSAAAPDEEDPQVYAQMKPDMVLRSWFADRGDDTPLDQYDEDYRDLCKDRHILFMAGLNASAIYPGQAHDKQEFDDWATQDSDGEPVEHPEYKQPKYLAALKTAPQSRGDTGAGRLKPPVMQRGSLANPRFRARLLKLMEAQIDLGADGVVLAESDALGYRGDPSQGFNGDEGYDPYALADFNHYLQDKYPDYMEANWEIQFQMSPANTVAVRLPWEAPRDDFDYRRYLKERDWLGDPRNRAGQPDRPLVGAWGDVPYPRALGDGSGFLAQSLAYYQKLMIEKVRRHARASQHREIVVAAEGMLPDVDVNEYPLVPDNVDDGGKPADYIPAHWDGSLDGAKSLLPVFKALRARSRRISGKALLVLYLSDDARDYARAYRSLDVDDKADYYRIYLPEAYACGAFMAYELREALRQQPSATQCGVMDLLTENAKFYKRNRELFTDADDGGRGVRCPDPLIACNVTEQDHWKRSLVHLINHHYDQGVMDAQTGVTVTVSAEEAPVMAYLVSPDLKDTPELPFHFQGQQVTLKVPKLSYYDIVVLKWPLAQPRRRDELTNAPSPTPLPTLPPTAQPTRTPWPTPQAQAPASAAASQWPAPPAAAAPLPPPISAPGFEAASPAPAEARAAQAGAATPTPTPTPTAPRLKPKATAPCTPGVMTVTKRVWVRPVLGDTRALGIKDVLRVGHHSGDQPEYSLDFTLTATARVWAETEVQAGLPEDTDAAPKVFMDDTFLGFLLVSNWRSPAALLLDRGLHHLVVRPSEGGRAPTVTLSRVRVVSDDGGHWNKVSGTQPCGCGGPPCPHATLTPTEP